MNWVGGSRNRLKMKNEAKKQKEFFEKMKMKNKFKNLEVASPKVSSFASMDLVTLFVVNQIAAKKEQKDPPKIAVLGPKKGKMRNLNPMILPMSPSSPSQLSLVESHPPSSVQSDRMRPIVPQPFKIWQASNNATLLKGEKKSSHMTLSPVVNCPYPDDSAADNLPPVGGTLSPLFPSSSTPGQAGNQPLPGWPPTTWETSGLDESPFQLFCEPAGTAGNIWSTNPDRSSEAFFRTPDVATKDPRFEDTFLSRVSRSEPALDFNPNQLGTEEDIFKGLIVDKSETDAFHFGSEKTKQYFKDEESVQASLPQIVPEPHTYEVQMPHCTMNFSCPEYPMSGWGASPTSSCKRGYLSSNSSHTEELAFSPRRASDETPEFCACYQKGTERTDAETQTIHRSALKTCDVATQCGARPDASPLVDASPQREATGGHCGCTEARVEGRGKSRRRPTLRRKKRFNSFKIFNAIFRRICVQYKFSKVRKGLCQGTLGKSLSWSEADRATAATVQGEPLQETADILPLAKEER
ncbi:uncharacterized protein LOC133494002 isoform X2 [Syngnathoides biaculeatus]|uniref:uncharacterized protein LOC133494002 isoform X2 n=1 Tax=Syngnathoides biaculeatus TaxID=300417 RepID=UPI002ADDC627|nr:uncharacterized protein LOC133494002 isoform X2 [Syngnathoides biaculeatus]